MEEAHAKPEFQQIAELFRRHGVEFIVIGGQAEILHGSPRVTYDVDVCYRRTPENLRAVASAMREIDATLRGAPAGLPFQLDACTFEMGMNFTFKTSIIDLDLLGHVEPIGGFDALLAHAETYPAYGMNILAVGLDDLLKVKLHINRPKDQESIFQLKAIKRIRDAQ